MLLLAVTGLVFSAFIVPDSRRALRAAARSIGLLPTAAEQWKWFEQTAHLPELPCPANGVVVVGFGQSNAANSAAVSQPPDPAKPAYVFFRGRCHAIGDPVPGTDLAMGSVWPPFATGLAEEVGRPVVVVAAAASGSSVLDWSSRAAGFGRRLEEMIRQLRGNGMQPDLLIWIQGETDADMAGRSNRRNGLASGAEYAAGLNRLFDRLGASLPKARFLVTLTSRCQAVSDGSAAIRAAQQQVVDMRADTFGGGDTDRFGDAYRRDGCHFNGAGVAEVAAMLVKNARDALER